MKCERDFERTWCRSSEKTVPSPLRPPVWIPSIGESTSGEEETKTFLSHPVGSTEDDEFLVEGEQKKGKLRKGKRDLGDLPSARRSGEIAEVQREVFRGERVTEL